jgi:hypothetical protein
MDAQLNFDIFESGVGTFVGTFVGTSVVLKFKTISGIDAYENLSSDTSSANLYLELV